LLEALCARIFFLISGFSSGKYTNWKSIFRFSTSLGWFLRIKTIFYQAIKPTSISQVPPVSGLRRKCQLLAKPVECCLIRRVEKKPTSDEEGGEAKPWTNAQCPQHDSRVGLREKGAGGAAMHRNTTCHHKHTHAQLRTLTQTCDFHGRTAAEANSHLETSAPKPAARHS